MRWAGTDLHNLIAKDVDELLTLYPEQNRKNIIRRKQEFTRKEKIMEGRLTKTWEVSAYDHKEGEWTTTTNHAYEHVPDVTIFEDWKPATPARITPSRRKPIQRDHKNEKDCYIPDR